MNKSNNESQVGAHVDMWHLMSGRKSTIKDKWIGRKSKEPIRNGHVASEITSHLTTIFSQPVWGEGKRGRDLEREKKKRILERDSTFSLNFPAISPSNSDETRGKVDPHCKSYAWVPVLWSFGNSKRWGFSSTWIFFL